MHLFTYGTLMFPEVWRAVVGLDVESTAAILRGYQIFRVRDALYPGIMAVDSPLTDDVRRSTSPATVSGLLYLNVDAAALARLDRIEGEEYRRRTVKVMCEDGRQLLAEAYVVPDESRRLLSDEVWSADGFQLRGDLVSFVAKYSGFNRLD